VSSDAKSLNLISRGDNKKNLGNEIQTF